MSVYIDEKEKYRRESDPRNLLNRIRKNTDPIETGPIEPEIVLPETEIRKLHNGGRREGVPNLPLFLQTLAGVSDRIDGPTQTAEEFGITIAHASHLGEGKTSPDHVNEELKEKIDEVSSSVSEIALKKLMKSLGLLTDEMLETVTKPKDLVDIASKMANVVERTREKKYEGDRTKILIYAPRIKNESEFDIIEVNTVV